MVASSEYFEPSDTAESRALIDRVCVSSRLEPRAAAERLDALGELFELRRVERGEEPDWAVDTWATVGAEVAAALRISLGMAGSYMHYARAMRDRLPQVRAGDIDYSMFRTIVYRTESITDAEAWPRWMRGWLCARRAGRR